MTDKLSFPRLKIIVIPALDAGIYPLQHLQIKKNPQKLKLPRILLILLNSEFCIRFNFCFFQKQKLNLHIHHISNFFQSFNTNFTGSFSTFNQNAANIIRILFKFHTFLAQRSKFFVQSFS